MQIGWVDYSDRQRQLSLQVLSALKETAAVDEIGVGVARDAFADCLFPSTSTLHTRAKYLFIVPYALRDLERDHDPRKAPAVLRREFDDVEKRIAMQLIQRSSRDEWGIVGRRSLGPALQGRWVKRPPSVIYWSALRRLGFLRDGSMDLGTYFVRVHQMDPCADAGYVPEVGDEGVVADDRSARASYWDVPRDAYRTWREDLGVRLTREEARFLRARIETCRNGLDDRPTLYALISEDEDLRAAALATMRSGAPSVGGDGDDVGSEDVLSDGVLTNAFVDFCDAAGPALPPDLRRVCSLAVAMSYVVLGCRLRYNAQIESQRDDALELWDLNLAHIQERIASLDVDEAFARLAMRRHANADELRQFLKAARSLLAKGDAAGLERLVRDRELRLKGGMAKIGRRGSAGEETRGTWVGGYLLSYRFEVASRFINEIAEVGGYDD